MVRKFGVSMPDDMAKEVERPLEYGDLRSQRIRELIELGLVVERQLFGSGFHGASQDRKIELLQEALDEYNFRIPSPTL